LLLTCSDFLLDLLYGHIDAIYQKSKLVFRFELKLKQVLYFEPEILCLL